LVVSGAQDVAGTRHDPGATTEEDDLEDGRFEEPSRLAGGAARPGEFEQLGPMAWLAGAAMVVLGLVAAVLMIRDVSSESYLYLAFYTIPANTGISVFPHEPALIWFGKHGSVLWAAVAAGAGTLVAGWLDHTVFVPVMNLRGLSGYKDLGWYRKLAGWFSRQPFWTLVLTGFTPIPFFPFKFLAFSVHYPMGRYLAALLVGRFPRYLYLAWLGRLIAIPDWLLIGVFLAISLTYAWKGVPGLVRRARTRKSVAPVAVPAPTGSAPTLPPGPRSGGPRTRRSA
jgi:membrane protein YqaA with SNARE-associated domain